MHPQLYACIWCCTVHCSIEFSKFQQCIRTGNNCRWRWGLQLSSCSYTWVMPLQGVNMSCSEIGVLHGGKTGFSHASADEQRFTNVCVMTRTAEIVQVCWNLSLAYREEPCCAVIVLLVVCLAHRHSRRQCVPGWYVMELEVETSSGSRGPVDR